MKVNFISREKNDAKFSIDFTAEEFENAQIKAYQKLKDKFDIDGFRKGKAPRSIIERKYGEGVFFEDAIDELFAENYIKAIDELNLDVVDTPRAKFGKIEKGKGFTVTLTVACAPEVEVKNYKGVEVAKIEAKVGAEQVKTELEALQKRNARRVIVSRAAKNGDTVKLDYSGFIGDKQFDGGTAENQKLTLGSGMFIPGFEEQLVGIKPGEKRDVKVTFPKEYHAEDLAGKEAVFHCLVHEVEEEQLPDLDDEFAKDVSEFDTLEELKKDLKKKITDRVNENALNQMKDAAIEKVYEKNLKFDVPEAMVEDELNRMADEMNQQLQYQGMTLEQYLQYLQMDMAQFKEQMKPDAEKSVKTRLILASIGAKEKLEVTDKELEAEIDIMAKMYNMEAKQIKEMLGDLSYLKKDMLIRKVIDYIYDNAKFVDAPKATAKKTVVEKDAPKKETAKKAAPKKETAEKKPAAKKAAPKKEAAEKAAPKKEAAKKTTTKKTTK